MYKNGPVTAITALIVHQSIPNIELKGLDDVLHFASLLGRKSLKEALLLREKL